MLKIFSMSPLYEMAYKVLRELYRCIHENGSLSVDGIYRCIHENLPAAADNNLTELFTYYVPW